MADETHDPLLEKGVEDHTKLSFFMDDVETRLGEIVDARHVIFPEEMREPLQTAFSELTDRESGQFRRVRQRLEYPDEEIREGLEGAGLTGNQLFMKLLGYVRARNAFRRRGGIQTLQRLLKWMNSLLGSLAGVPGLGTLVEPIKELKEAIENMLEDIEG
jgi:hypothetical protein